MSATSSAAGRQEAVALGLHRLLWRLRAAEDQLYCLRLRALLNLADDPEVAECLP